MSECAKRGCSYYWQEEGEAYPRYHGESRCPVMLPLVMRMTYTMLTSPRANGNGTTILI